LLAKDALESYIKAGRIASEVRKEARSLVREGAPLLNICEAVEKLTREKGGVPAFPCNVCINEIAAHYSSPPSDTSLVPRGSLVKVDIGVHVDGYIADTATTVSLSSELDPMVQGVNEALTQALKAVGPGARTSSIGETIEKTVERFGFRPIWNLGGHQMSRFILHTGKSIPNIHSLSFEKLREDEVYAIEPFLTLRSAKGAVIGREREMYIHRFQKEKRLRLTESRRLLTEIRSDYRSLPFSRRWLSSTWSRETLEAAFKELVQERCVMGYPVLVEETSQAVSQAEHTIIVMKDGCLVTTL
jgi:methionyl aminopeptidase